MVKENISMFNQYVIQRTQTESQTQKVPTTGAKLHRIKPELIPETLAGSWEVSGGLRFNRAKQNPKH